MYLFGKIGTMQFFLGFLAGGALGGAVVWVLWGAKMQTVREKIRNELVAERASMVEQLRGKDARIEELRQEGSDRTRTLTTYQDRLTQAASQLATAEAQLLATQQQANEKLSLLTSMQHSMQQQLSDTFQALSSQALQANNQSFLALAETRLSEFQTAAKGDLALKQQAVAEVVKPLQSSLSKVETFLQSIEGQRVGAYAQLTEQISALASAQGQLQMETANLAKALRSPTVRGRWGEIQLKRVIEIAGMSEHCDFTQQTSHAEGLRPDLLVHLPGARQIVVDAKAPLSA